MVRTRWFASLLVLAVLALLAGACGSSGGKPAATPGGNKVVPDECGLAAFAKATKPVEVTFWHAMARANGTWLVKTVKAFNASQHDVRVKLITLPNYQDALTKYKAGLKTGDLPDLVQLEETAVQVLVDSQSTIPMQACTEADHYALSDFVPRATAYYSTDGVLRAMPWAVSNPVLFYDAAAFRKAGLDPNKPPTTYAEIEAASRKIVASGVAKHGISLHIEPYVFEYLNAKSGSTLVNNGNGRSARATAATIDTPVALQIWTWWKHMVSSGLALNTGPTEGNIDHLLAVANHDAAMTFEASSALGTIRSVLQSGQFKGIELSAAPLPSLQAGGGVPVGESALWIPKASSPVKRAAAWQFVKYLSSPEQQAALAIAGGFAPIRQSSASEPALEREWRTDPSFRAGYDQLMSGTPSAANVGSLIGDYQGVRDAVRDGLSAMLQRNMTPKQALELAQNEATQKIQAYNSRVAG